MKITGLDALNALVASSQTGFGAFIAVYLTQQHWTQTDIGTALSLGTAVAMVGQIPAGALVDRMRSKRLAVGVGASAITISALIFAITPHRAPVLLAEILHGFASCLIGPAIAALSLQLVGQAGLGERLGRNARWASIGSAVAALALGSLGTWVSNRAVFYATAGLMAGGLLTLRGASGPPPTPTRPLTGRMAEVLDRPLLTFAACLVLFHLGNAAMLPLVAAEVTRSAGRWATLIIAACIVAPQAIVAGLSPWVAYRADTAGRRGLLLLGFATLPVRGVLLSLGNDPAPLILIQALEGVSGAVLGVLVPLVAADLARDGGRYTLRMGVLGLAVGLGATISTALAGVIADRAGPQSALLVLSAIGVLATSGLLLMPETRVTHGGNPGNRGNPGM